VTAEARDVHHQDRPFELVETYRADKYHYSVNLVE
jgi:hypothetical protein